jgi:hypothetical protein
MAQIDTFSQLTSTILAHGVPSFFILEIGIGLPGVAASGTIAANTLVDPIAQLRLMGELKRTGALQ